MRLACVFGQAGGIDHLHRRFTSLQQARHGDRDAARLEGLEQLREFAAPAFLGQHVLDLAVFAGRACTHDVEVHCVAFRIDTQADEVVAPVGPLEVCNAAFDEQGLFDLLDGIAEILE